jgi:hypothetical protein
MDRYSERVGWPAWLHLVMVVCVVAGALGALPFFRGQGGAIHLVPLGVAAVLALVWWKMRFLCLEIDAEEVSFGFGRPGRVVRRARVRTAAPEDYSAIRYMGWGYRIGGPPRDRAYSVIGCRRGVRLVFADEQDREWSVFVACRDPEAALDALGLGD